MNFFKNKSVVMVGPSSYLEGSKMGRIIDSFDVVVRINNIHDNFNESLNNDFGKRTDVVYFDGSIDDNRLESYLRVRPKLLICSYPETEWFFSERCSSSIDRVQNLFRTEIIDQNLYSKLKHDLDSNLKVRPNSGLSGIVDLLNKKLKKLYVTGIDFYRNSYASHHPDYGNSSLEKVKSIFRGGDNGDCHDINKQFMYFKRLFLKNKKLEVDKTLNKYLTDSKYENVDF